MPTPKQLVARAKKFEVLRNELERLSSSKMVDPTPDVLATLRRASNELEQALQEALAAREITSGQAAEFNLVILNTRTLLQQYGFKTPEKTHGKN